MKRFLAAAGLAALAALLWLVARPSDGRRALRLPAILTAPLRRGTAPAGPTQAAVPPPVRPNLRALKVAEVPAPGASPTPEQVVASVEGDAAARAPRLDARRLSHSEPPGSRTSAFALSAPPAETAAPPPAWADGLVGPQSQAPGRRPPEPAAPRQLQEQAEGEHWAAPASAITQQTGRLKATVSGRVPAALSHGLPTGSSPADSLMRQILIDQRVESGVRGALKDIRSIQGRPATMEEAEETAASVLKSHGLAAGPEDVSAALQMAAGLPLPPVPPEILAATVARMSSRLPDDKTATKIARQAEKPPPKPTAPAPRGALEAYQRSRNTLEKAQRDFGVAPHHVLGILGVETNWGRNTGNYPVNQVLYSIAAKNPPDSAKARQAARDRAALARLDARGDLGNRDAAEVRGSYAGAMGVAQFLPSSWEALARSPSGGARDPFDFDTAAYSAANYLHSSGYSRSVSKAIFAYNHSQEYVDKVLGLSNQIQNTLQQSPPADPKKK